MDHRADIFAFGALLDEMLTAKRAFQCGTWADTMSAILHAEPPALPPSPAERSRGRGKSVIQKCLAKAPDQRFQTTTDVISALDALADSSTSPSASTGRVGYTETRTP